MSTIGSGRLLRARLRAGESLLGTFAGISAPVAIEVACAAGLDWLLLDLEHGAGGEQELSGAVLAAAAYGVPVLARTETQDRIRIGRALDAGVSGVMVPRLDTADQAADALRHFRYPPGGDRGVATYNRSAVFGLAPERLHAPAEDAALGVVQVESAAMLTEAEQLAQLDGVDVLFVGPLDLSFSLGVPRQFDAPIFVDALQAIVRAAEANGKAAGILATDNAGVSLALERGFRFVSISSIATVIATSFRDALASARRARS